MAGTLNPEGVARRPGGLRRLARLAVAPLLLLVDALWIGFAPIPPPASLALAATGALCVALGTAGFRLAGLLVAGEGWPARLAASFLAAATLAVLPALVLGHLGWLRPAVYLVSIAVLTALARALPERPVGPSPFSPRPPLPADARGLAGLERTERSLLVAALAALAVLWAVGIRDHRVAPPGIFGVDDNSYQLSTVATWLDEGRLVMPRPSMGDPSTPYYPLLAQLVSWALVAPFEDLDVAARWSQLPFALATLAVVWSLAGRLGLGRRAAAVAVAALAVLPRFFPALALGAGNDHASAFALLITVDALLRMVEGVGDRRRTVTGGVYLGLGLGWVVGTKYLSLLYLPPVMAVGALAAAVAVARTPAAEQWREAARVGLAGLVAGATATAVGGYTYLRNWASVDNPVFPSPVHWGSTEIFAGWEQTTLAFRRLAPEFSLELPGFFIHRPELWGWVGPWVLVPAALAAPVVALRLGRLLDAAVLALPLVLFGIFLEMVPDHREIRYLLAAIALAALGAGFLTHRLEQAGAWGRGLALLLRSGLWVAVVAHLLTAEMPLWGVGVAWAGLALLAVLELRRPGDVPRRLLTGLRRPAVMAVLGLCLLLVGRYTVGRYEERKLENRPAPHFLAEHWTGGRVAYVGFNSPYLFWGNRLEHGVVLVPTACVPPASRLYGWGPVDPPETHWPFTERHARYRCWYRNLEQLDVRWVVVVRPWDVEPERPWMVRDPSAFELRYQDDDVEIWSAEL